MPGPPRRSEPDYRQEVEAHIALEADRLIAEGMSASDARDAARRKFGNVTRAEKRFYQSRGAGWIEALGLDVRDARRSLARTPAFTAVAALSLALALGLSTSIFSVLDGVLLRPLPFPQAARLVRLFETNVEANRPAANASPANVADWREASKTIDLITAVGFTSHTLTGGAEPEQIVAMVVGRDFSALLGVQVAVGRSLAAADYEAPANAGLGPVRNASSPPGLATVVISHALWHRQFGGDRQIAGRHIRLSGRDASIIGVMPRDFRFDETPIGTADCWVPFVETGLDRFRRLRQFIAVGRLAPDRSLDEAQAEMNVIAAALETEYPRDNTGWHVRVTSLQESVVGDARRALLILAGGVGSVLLIACANIANLLLMRAVGRSREVAVRLAMGAARWRLVRQWLAESVVLSVIGGGAGFAVALWAVPTLVAFAPPNLPRVDEIGVDWRVFGFGVLLSLATGIVCGLAPALEMRVGNIAGVLRAIGGTTDGPRRRWLRQGLVVAQVALAVVLLVGAGLMVRTLAALHAVDLGFNPGGVLTFGVAGMAAPRAFNSVFVPRLEAIPGVDAAGVGSVPLVGGIFNRFRVEDRDAPVDGRMDAPSPGYFRALGIRLARGRLFAETDDQGNTPVAIVNRAFARVAWGSDDVVGRRLSLDQAQTWITIVGVVDDLRMSSIDAEPSSVVYLPYLQSSVASFTNYVIRTDGNPRRMLPLVRAAVSEWDSTLAVTRIATMDERLERALAPRSFSLSLIGLFALVAGILAIVGVYGLVSESVASRTPEIGVRVALGARRSQVITFVVGRSAALTALGIMLGVAGAAAVTRFLEGMLFGLSPLDPTTFVSVAAMFALVAVAAGVVPARRATRVDPVVALRCE